MRMRATWVALCICISSVASFAQDIHFSQFYISPLTLNSALTGYMDADYRVAAIYRNQWNTVTTPYQTYGGSFDMRVMKSKLKNDVWGVGAVIVNDKSGNGDVGLLSFMASTAYHKKLGSKGPHFLGLGIQVGYVQRSLQYQNLTFPNQYDGSTFNTSTSNGETNLGDKTSYIDLQAGLSWSGQLSKRIGLLGGFALHHLTQPKESFLGENVRLKQRYTAHFGARIKVIESLYITPNVLFMYQNQARQLNFGTAIEYHIKPGDEPVVVSLGGWYRLQDAGIISAGAEFKRVRVGISYDITTSPLKQVPKPTGSFEIGLVYTGLLPSNDIGPVLVPCPRL